MIHTHTLTSVVQMFPSCEIVNLTSFWAPQSRGVDKNVDPLISSYYLVLGVMRLKMNSRDFPHQRVFPGAGEFHCLWESSRKPLVSPEGAVWGLINVLSAGLVWRLQAWKVKTKINLWLQSWKAESLPDFRSCSSCCRTSDATNRTALYLWAHCGTAAFCVLCLCLCSYATSSAWLLRWAFTHCPWPSSPSNPLAVYLWLWRVCINSDLKWVWLKLNLPFLLDNMPVELPVDLSALIQSGPYVFGHWHFGSVRHHSRFQIKHKKEEFKAQTVSFHLRVRLNILNELCS